MARVRRRRRDFVDLVGRGKAGLGLEAESEQLVAIDGQQPICGGGGASREAAASPMAEPHQGSGAASPAALGDGGRPGIVASIRLMTFRKNWERTIGPA